MFVLHVTCYPLLVTEPEGVLYVSIHDRVTYLSCRFCISLGYSGISSENCLGKSIRIARNIGKLCY